MKIVKQSFVSKFSHLPEILFHITFTHNLFLTLATLIKPLVYSML